MYATFQKIKQDSKELSKCGANKRNEVLEHIALLLDKNRKKIQKENLKDIQKAEQDKQNPALIQRLLLQDKHIDSMIMAVKQIALQEEVIGKVISGSVRPSGIKITKIKVPLGVVAMIYESRPNVTIDASALCIKSGNAVILKGGKEALHSNIILSSLVRQALKLASLPEDIVYCITTSNREQIIQMLQAQGLIDVVIPRGGEGLINFVLEHSKIPVIMHNKGVCHTYIDKSANLTMALDICLNAKVQRPSACNALETLLIHKDIAKAFLPEIYKAFMQANTILKGCEKTLQIIDIVAASDDDWGKEFGDLILAIKIVESTSEAIHHINRYGSNHSEVIITQDYSKAQRFLDEVDAAAVYVNASSRFSDGGEFGLGAEIGISTQKLHARGPMGAEDLTTTKYLIYGNGEIRK